MLSKDIDPSGDESVDEVLARIRAECEIYLNTDHPNINRLRDMYETDDAIYLVRFFRVFWSYNTISLKTKHT